MNKKIFAILSLAIIAIVCAGTVSAFDFGSLFGGDDANDETVTIDGIDFNIPAGFKEDPDYEIDNETDLGEVSFKTVGKTYESGDSVLAILVSEYDGMELTDSVVSAAGGDSYSVNDVDGYYKQEGNFHLFTYVKDNKLVVISASSQDLFEDVVIK